VRFFLLLIASTALGVAARAIPSHFGWIYEIAAPFLCAGLIMILWRQSSLARRYTLFTFALCIGWLADWVLHALFHHPDSPRALAAGLLLLAIRFAVGTPFIISLHLFLSGNPAHPVVGQQINLLEAGAISGILCGAALGALICKSHGLLAAAIGLLAGLICGAVAGWLYSLLELFLLAIISGLWLTARKIPRTSLTAAQMTAATRTAAPGILVGVLSGTFLAAKSDWAHALLAMLLVAFATALLAVARCQLRTPPDPSVLPKSP